MSVTTLKSLWRKETEQNLYAGQRVRPGSWALMLILVVMVAGCRRAPEPTPAPPVALATDVAEPAATATATLTATPLPSATATATQPPTATATATESPTATATATPTPEPTSAYPALALEPIDSDIHAYPGPVHYEGDLLNVEIVVGDFVGVTEGAVSVQIDGGEPYTVTGNWSGNYLLVPIDTTGLTGRHTVSIEAEEEGVQVDEELEIELLPAAGRAAQEEGATWNTREVDCCVLHYMTHTAAGRDIDQIASTVQEAADDLEAFANFEITRTIDIYFIDRLWFNGAFGGNGELVASYTDRYYGPAVGEAGLEVIVRHELGHAADFPFFSYGEGLSVYLAGGHYKPEPLPERAAAMLELGYYSPDSGPLPQHEVRYLHQAALINYIVETYGWDKLWEFMVADSKQPTATPEERSEIVSSTLGVSSEELERDFAEWARAHDPGEQVEDLALTVELQDLRREYQEKYAPFPQFLLTLTGGRWAEPRYIPTNIREARTPANMAAELLIDNAQEAIFEGRYDDARALIEAIEPIVESGRLEHPLAREYAAITVGLAERGYETVSLALDGLGDSTAVVEVAESPPELETVMLEKVDGLWRMGDVVFEPAAEPAVAAETPTPAPAASAPPPTPVEVPPDALYYDDFSDPTSGWDRIDEQRIFANYIDNAYRIWIDNGNTSYWYSTEETFGPAVLETSVTLQGGPDVNRFGVHCGFDGDGSWEMIQFLLDGQGRYGILWVDPQAIDETREIYLGAEGMQPSPAVNPAGERNLLRAVCGADSVSLWVNGEQLLTAENPMTIDGSIGMVVYGFGGPGVDALYDYLLVTEP